MVDKKEKMRKNQRAYEQRPDVKARRKAYFQAYYQLPEIKERQKARHATPEYKEKQKAYNKTRRKIDDEQKRVWKNAYYKTERGKAKILKGVHQRRIKLSYSPFDSEAWKRMMSASPICLMCGRFVESENLSIDHITPVSKGGDNRISNIQPLCRPCNSTKQNFIYEKQSGFLDKR